jgi:hypothetical protein
MIIVLIGMMMMLYNSEWTIFKITALSALYSTIFRQKQLHNLQHTAKKKKTCPPPPPNPNKIAIHYSRKKLQKENQVFGPATPTNHTTPVRNSYDHGN